MMEFWVTWLLRVSWILGTLPILIAIIPSSRLISFHRFLLDFAKRGKIMESSSSQKFTVPQKFFLHFYLLAVVWTSALLLATWHYASKMAPLGSDSMHYSVIASQLTGGSHTFSLHKSHATSALQRYNVWKSVFLLLLMETHVIKRLYETVYVFNYRREARMHILGYLTGLFFYLAAPLSLCASCAVEIFNFSIDQMAEYDVKHKDMMSINEFHWWGYLMPITKLGWQQWAGTAIFLWGWIHQLRCHAILGSLRQHTKHHDKYIIPRGDWFEYVSSPHYLAEMIIYAGLLVASGGLDLTIWLLVGFVVANLVLAAAETHRWYLHKFDDYPRNRMSIFPLVY